MKKNTELSYQERRDRAQLCYIGGDFIGNDWAFFTTQDLDKQRGDDWEDVPYECNAGKPYTYAEYHEERGEEPWEIFRVAFLTNLSTPDEEHLNSPYSVRAINSGGVPWLRGLYGKSHWISIMAGITFKKFAEVIHRTGGTVYVPYGTE